MRFLALISYIKRTPPGLLVGTKNLLRIYRGLCKYLNSTLIPHILIGHGNIFFVKPEQQRLCFLIHFRSSSSCMYTRKFKVVFLCKLLKKTISFWIIGFTRILSPLLNTQNESVHICGMREKNCAHSLNTECSCLFLQRMWNANIFRLICTEPVAEYTVWNCTHLLNIENETAYIQMAHMHRPTEVPWIQLYRQIL